jgi:hypothetical protein
LINEQLSPNNSIKEIMNQDLISFYGTLFATEFTIWGVIAAVIFVFIQIIYATFSSNELIYIYKNIFFKLYIFIGICSLILCTIGFLCSSYPEIFLWINFDMFSTIISPGFAYSSILMFFISIGLFLLWVMTNIGYLHPTKMLLLSKNSITHDQLSKFLLKKYGLQPPSEVATFIRISGYMGDKILSKGYTAEMGLGNLSPDEKRDYELKKIEFKEAELKYSQKIIKIKKEAENNSDPFIPINTVAIRSIEKYDISTLNDIKLMTIEIVRNFIKDNNKVSANWGPHWNPYNELSESLVDHIIENLRIQIEICNNNRFLQGSLTLMSITEDIASLVMTVEKQQRNGILKLLDFWKLSANQSIGLNPSLFYQIIRQYSQLIDILFELKDEPTGLMDEIFRNLGWISEQSKFKDAFKISPIMYDSGHQTEYDSLMNCILSAGDKYINKRPNWYPLVYIGAVRSILESTISILLGKKELTERQNNIFSLIYTIFRYFEAALEIGNINGIKLAYSSISQIYEYLKDTGYDKAIEQTVNLITDMGARISDREDLTLFGSNKPIFEDIIELLSRDNHPGIIQLTLHEAYIHRHTEFQNDHFWKFVKKLGKLRKTNFDFMFDWETGEPYAKDDPRRH